MPGESKIMKAQSARAKEAPLKGVGGRGESSFRPLGTYSTA